MSRPSEAVRAQAQAPCIVRADSVGASPKYWTGELLGRWPVYVSDRDRALAMPRRNAEHAAAEFNARMPLVAWSAQPIET